MTAPLRIEKARTGLWATLAPWHVYLRMPPPRLLPMALPDGRLVLGRFATFDHARRFAIKHCTGRPA